MSTQDLVIEDFTNAVKPLTNFLADTFPDGICVSDVRDALGRQLVDLVQEGGGVHGIALAGYTFILETMNIGFMKMAGTSAGSINTLLLNAVYSKKEAEALGITSGVIYYNTRSEKVLEYLSKKNLSDLVDGHPLWRKLILSLFTPKGNLAKKQITSVKRATIFSGIFLLLSLVSSIILSFYTAPDFFHQLIRWSTVLSCIGLVASLSIIFSKLVLARLLYKHAERFGINPGKNFEDWLVNDILKENGILSVEHLQAKFKKEQETFKPGYSVCKIQMETAPHLSETHTRNLYSSLQRITDPNAKVESFLDELSAALIPDEAVKKEHFDFAMNKVMSAFETRLAKEEEVLVDQGINPVTKELVIVSSDITHGLKVEFPGMHKMYWGDDYSISPAKYVRASMSVPLFFKPFQVDLNPSFTIQQEWSKLLKVQKNLEKFALFVDGGLLSNFPINVFYNPDMPVPRKPTLGIKLEYEDDSMQTDIKNLLDFGGSIINTMRYFYDRDFALKHDIYQKTVRSIDTGKIHWLNFNLSDEEKIELFFRGALTATIFLARHKITATDTQHLMQMGKEVAFKETKFSIYENDVVNFKTEDCMMGDVLFEWQQYKRERLFDRVSKDDKKDNLKQNAAMNFSKK
jgi:NTE family protein